jgi:small subunit ribosomal protein S1
VPTVLTQSSPPLRSVDYFYEILNRDAKRILVSHLRTWEERKEAAPKATKKAAKEEPQVEMPKVEKTTLGDLSALAELKASMEQAEEKPAKKAAAKKATKKTEE